MAPRKKSKKTSVSDALLKRYHDPSKPGSLGGVQRFAKAWKLPLKRTQNLLQKDLAYSLHKPRRRKFPTLRVMVGNMDEQWVADLIETQNIAKENQGISYLLTVIDVLSKYAWVRPLKNKTGSSVVEAFKDIVKEGRKPLRVQTDKGKEFYNTDVKNLVESQNIHHFYTHGDTKASVVERFNRTFKQRMYRYFTAANTLKFTDILQDLVKGYNATSHRSIGMAPNQVTWKNQGKVRDKLYGKPPKRRKPTLKVGDLVRLNKIHRTFKKAYLPGWTEEVFVVDRINPGPIPTYKLKEWDETPLEGTFYEEDLQKVYVTDIFRVEKVLKRRKDQLLVKWKGWPDKYNSWISSKDIV